MNTGGAAAGVSVVVVASVLQTGTTIIFEAIGAFSF